MQGEVALYLPTTPWLLHHPPHIAFTEAALSLKSLNDGGEPHQSLSLGPPELKAWCERGATGEGKLFLQGHCPYPGSGGKSNNAGRWKLYSPMQSAGPL